MSKSVVSLPMYFLYTSQMVFKICRLRMHKGAYIIYLKYIHMYDFKNKHLISLFFIGSTILS